MAKWTVVVSPEQFKLERLYGADTVTVPGATDAVPAGDEALLVAATAEPVVFGLARADGTGALRYTVNLLDAPLPAAGVAAGMVPGAHPMDEAAYGSVS